MNVLSSAFYLFACVILATLLTKWIMIRAAEEDGISRFLAWIVFFFAVFLGGFYILGYVNLVTNLPVLNPVDGSVIVTFTFAGFRVWFYIKKPDLLKSGWNIGRLCNSAQQVSIFNTGLSRLIVIVTLVNFTLIALMLIAGFPRGFEPTAYHLPISLHIFQAQSLKVWDSVFMHTYPANVSIYFGFLLGFISEHLASAAGLVFLIPLVVAVYGLGRMTGADKTASLFASIGTMTIPIIAFSTFEAGADVGGAAFLAIAVYFAISNSHNRHSYHVLCGLAAGIAFGFKSLHLISIVFLFILILFQTWSKFWGKLSKKSFLSMCQPPLIFLITVLAISGFWLIRNYVQLGNPLYPVHYPILDIFGWTKAPDHDFTNSAHSQFQWVRSSVEWFFYPWLEWHRFDENFKHSSGLGAFFASTVPIACFASLFGVIKRKDERWPIIAILLGGGIFVLLVWWILGSREPRYFIGALIFLIPLVAWTVSQAKGRPRKVYEFIIVLCILSMFFVIFSKQFVEFGKHFIYFKQTTRQEFYRYPSMIDQLPPGSKVVNLGTRTWNYPLFGKTHQNRVVSFKEAVRVLETRGLGKNSNHKYVHLSLSALHKLNATHLFTEGNFWFTLEECILLREIDRVDKHPLNGTPLSNPCILYRIEYCDKKNRNYK